MKNDKKIKMLIGIVFVVCITVFALFIVNRNQNKDTIATTQKAVTQEKSSINERVAPNVNSDDYKLFIQQKGEDYDRLFIANMIEHHQGAVDMANLALQNANHQEIKDMARSIIDTQTTEITSMKTWQSLWGYPPSSGENMMDHSAMYMMDSMALMTQSLKGLSGDAFDKMFIKQMIMHHQSAIDMAASGEENAYHVEVKELTQAIIKAQSNEIAEMRQWQNNWGYTN